MTIFPIYKNRFFRHQYYCWLSPKRVEMKFEERSSAEENAYHHFLFKFKPIRTSIWYYVDRQYKQATAKRYRHWISPLLRWTCQLYDLFAVAVITYLDILVSMDMLENSGTHYSLQTLRIPFLHSSKTIMSMWKHFHKSEWKWFLLST